jgi:hypothetical protein
LNRRTLPWVVLSDWARSGRPAVADRDVHLAVRAERDRPAVVVVGRVGEPDQVDAAAAGGHVAGRREPADHALRGGRAARPVGVDVPVGRELRVDGDAEQAALERRPHRQRGERRREELVVLTTRIWPAFCWATNTRPSGATAIPLVYGMSGTTVVWVNPAGTENKTRDSKPSTGSRRAMVRRFKTFPPSDVINQR